MKARYALAVLLLAVACTPKSNDARVASDGGTEIRFVDGQNCWQGRCVRYSKKDRWISVPGRNPVLAPKDIDLRDGYVSEAEFQRMFATANRALSRGVGSATR